MKWHAHDSNPHGSKTRGRAIRRGFVAVAGALLLAVTALPTGAGAAEKEEPAFKALLFTRAVGYVHGSIPNGIKMFEEEAAENGFEIVQSADPTVFSDDNLAQYDAIVMLQNSGMVWDTEAQRQAMKTYVQSGKGVVAIHNTLDMGVEEAFPWWDETINGGAHMPTHSPGVLQGTAKVADQVHPPPRDFPSAGAPRGVVQLRREPPR